MVLNQFGRTLADVEREHILETLSACGGNRTHTARLLEISVRSLRMKLQRFNQLETPISAADAGSPGRDGGRPDAAHAP